MSKSKRNVAKIYRGVSSKDEYSIIIPGAGLGQRMKSYGPKPLIEIKKNLTILDNQLNIINKSFPKKQIVLVGGFESKILFDKSPRNLVKVENERFENTNVVRSLALGLRAAINKRVLIIYGDLIFNQEIFNAIKLDNSGIFLSTRMKNEEVGCTLHNDFAQNFLPDIKNKWAQIVFLKGKELELFRDFCFNKNNEVCFGFEALNHIINNRGKLKIIKSVECADIDSSKDFKIIRKIL